MNRLTDKDFSFKCPMSWDDMENSANGKFCSKCRKEVFDLTNCSTDEVRALQEKHGSICGSIRVAQAAVVALSLSAAACQKTEPTTGTPRRIAPPSNNTKASNKVDPKPVQPENAPRLMGEICPHAVDAPKDIPIKNADPFAPDLHPPMILGKVELRPDFDPEDPSRPKIDI